MNDYKILHRFIAKFIQAKLEAYYNIEKLTIPLDANEVSFYSFRNLKIISISIHPNAISM